MGDDLCLLEGCTLPVILRRESDRSEAVKPVYTIIGDAHVSGIMSGEMWPSTAELNLNTEEIWIG